MMDNFRLGVASIALVSALAAPLAHAAEETEVARKQSITREQLEANRQRAREANEAAVYAATQSVLAATKLDLDIRLIGHISVAARQ